MAQPAVGQASVELIFDNSMGRLGGQYNNYQEIKKLESIYKAELLSLKWQNLKQEQQLLEQQLNQLLNEYERHQSILASIYKQNTATRISIEQVKDTLQMQQVQAYQLTIDIGRLEKQIQVKAQEEQRLLTEKQQIQLQQRALTNQLQQDNETLKEYEHTLNKVQVDLEKSQKQFLLHHQQAYQVVQEEKSCWQSKFEQTQHSLVQAERELQVQQVHSQHINRQRQNVQLRLEKNKELLSSLDQEIEAIHLPEQDAILVTLERKQKQQEKDYQALLLILDDVRQQHTQTEINLCKAHDHYQQLNTAHAALTVMLKSAVDINDYASINKGRHLLERLTVDKEWKYACEVVLKDYLQAIVVESVDDILEKIPQILDRPQCFTVSGLSFAKDKPYPCLAEKMTGITPYFLPRLHKIFTALTLAEARAWLPHINEDESILTSDGCWIAKGWVQIAGKDRDDSFNLLNNQAKLNLLNKEHKQTKEDVTLLQ